MNDGTSRTIVVTGSASGIGKATTELLRSRGDTVIGVDLHDAEILADLETPDGRSGVVEQVRRLAGDSIDGVLSIAGVPTSAPSTVSLNYFGMIAVLEGLQPLLAASPHPRAVAISSVRALQQVDDDLMHAMAADDEARSLARASELAADPDTWQYLIYSSTKSAISHWVRRAAPSDRWAARGIALNCVAPGVIVTPQTAYRFANDELRRETLAEFPMVLNGFADPVVPARLLAWLVGEQNSHLCGQILYVDGGCDAILRPDRT